MSGGAGVPVSVTDPVDSRVSADVWRAGLQESLPPRLVRWGCDVAADPLVKPS